MRTGKSVSATITELALALIIIAVLLVALWFLLLRDRDPGPPNQTLQESVGLVAASEDTAENAVRDLQLSETLTPVPIQPPPIPSPPPLERVHAVASGETLISIAEAYEVAWEALAELNGIDDPRSLQIGQELQIPS
jgi:LysM repeat protein